MERIDTREELLHFEGLGQVVVGSGPKPRDPIVELATRGQHEHGHRWLTSRQSGAKVQSISVRQHPIEDDDVERSLRKLELGASERAAHDRPMPFFAKHAPEKLSKLRIVFDDEEIHGPNLHPPRLSRILRERKTAPRPQDGRPAVMVRSSLVLLALIAPLAGGCRRAAAERRMLEAPPYSMTSKNELRVRPDLFALLTFREVAAATSHATIRGFGRVAFAPNSAYAVRSSAAGFVDSGERSGRRSRRDSGTPSSARASPSPDD
jgi:hypothetical protein